MGRAYSLWLREFRFVTTAGGVTNRGCCIDQEECRCDSGDNETLANVGMHKAIVYHLVQGELTRVT